MKKTILIFIIVFFILFSVFLYDKTLGQKGEPHFYKVTLRFFCNSWAGITLPPAGIWICPDYYNDQEVIKHELVHWEQYKRSSALGFYIQYVIGWIYAGFSYENNWMEKEAREKSVIYP